MELRAAKDLKTAYGIDALLMSDMEVLYVDADELMSDDLANRLRFSLAHEVGHRVLHRAYYESQSITRLEDAYAFIGALSQVEYDNLEWQAHQFAGRLLVSPDRLVVEAQKLIDEFAEEIAKLDVEPRVILEQSVPRLARKFGISESAMSMRVSKESLVERLEWLKP